MSDDNLNDSAHSEEDNRLLELMDRLGPETDPTDRAYVEALGLLPYSLEELPPRPELKQRLMASLGSPETGDAGANLPSPTGRLVVLERRARWFLPLAATIAVALLGLAGLQFRQLQSQQRTIDELSSQLERVERNGVELAEIRRALDQRGDQLRMLTARGAEFCVLKPVGDQPRYPLATATMVIAPDRDRWYLAAEGLEPCTEETCYQLWFITDAESIPAASFGARATDERIELTGNRQSVPPGVRGVSITRSAGRESSEAPETVLFADQAMTLL